MLKPLDQGLLPMVIWSAFGASVVWLLSLPFILASVLAGSPGWAQQSRFQQTGVIGCLAVPPELGRMVANMRLGTCQIRCRGCGCKAGPGFRAPNGQCVGFANINAKCGPPPHKGCRAECAAVALGCEAFGRLHVAALAAAQGATLVWLKADPEPADTEPSNSAAASPKPAPAEPSQVATPLKPPVLLAAREALSKQAIGGAWQTSVMRCGTKRYCREMTSCEEALFHYQQCGIRRLARGDDGVPCKALCNR